MELQEISTVVCKAYDKQELRLLARKAVAQVFDNPIDVEFLSEVGIPLVEEFEVNFNLAEQFPLLRNYIFEKGEYLADWPKQIRCFNEKDGAVYGIDKGQDDAVVCLDMNGDYAPKFISSKLTYFIAFRAECRLHLDRLRSGKMTRERSFEMALDRMRIWDVKAVNQGWWQGVFETLNFYG